MKKILSFALAIIMITGALFVLSSCKKEELKFGKDYRPLTAQMDVLMQLDSKSIDVGIMDSIMAGYYMSQTDSPYSSSLMIVDSINFEAEQYGIAARKGSGLAKKINAALIELSKDGTVKTIADKYGIASELCIDDTITVEPLTASEQADWDYITSQEKFIVGYTIFAPIAYKDNGKLIGFDIELAQAVAEKLGVAVEFKEIDWNAKETLLEAKTIDCVWNGMTITEERLANMEISIPYLKNKQVAIIRVEDKDKYTSLDTMDKAIIGAEAGSAGESCVLVEEKE